MVRLTTTAGEDLTIMAKTITNKLTVLAVKNAGPGLHADGGSLYLEVNDTGAKAWAFRFQIAGRRRLMRIGSAKDITLAEARQRAGELRRLVAEGVDPIERKAQEEAARAVVTVAEASPTAPTFAAVLEDYIEAHRASWTPKTEAQWRASLTMHASAILTMPVNEIDVDAVMAVLKPIWSTRTETATRVRARIEIVLDAATVRKLRTGPNPAQWRGNLALLLPKPGDVTEVKHHKALDWKDAPTFYADLRGRFGITATATEWLILSGVRCSEAAGARWCEIDIPNATWSIPGDRMKEGKPHRVPLSDRMLALLESLPRKSAWLFPGIAGRQHVHPVSILRFIKRDMGYPDITAHGWRSTLRDWAADHGYALEVAEAVLAHAGDKLVRTYRRGDAFDLRKPLMEQWARYLASGGKVD